MRCRGLRPARGHPKAVLFIYGESLGTVKAAFTLSRMGGEESASGHFFSLCLRSEMKYGCLGDKVRQL